MTTAASEKASSQKPASSRSLGKLGHALDWRISRLQVEYLRGSPAARADLAKLRRGLGKPAGSVPEIWELTIGVVPGSLTWSRDEPSVAEQATHAALTLYALHQQSQSAPAHVPGTSFGQAVGRLRFSDARSEEAVTRRFMAVATAETIDEVLIHARGLITQLRGEQGLDYARFANDLFGLLTPATAQSVRLAWGRAFYRTAPDAPDNTGETGQPTDITE